MFFRELFKELEERKIKYLAIGGIAVNLYGYDRNTGDIDIMISFDAENVKKFSEMAASMGLKPKAPVDLSELADPKKRELWKNEKNMKVFSLYDTNDDFIILDVMIQDYIDFDEAYKKKKVIKELGLEVSLVSIDDLIKLKEIASRSRDIGDIEALKKIKEISNGQ